MSAAPLLFQHLKRTGRELAQGLVQLLYPGACLVCSQPLPADQQDFCSPCRTALVTDPHAACPRCAADVGPFSETGEGCLRCRNESFFFGSVLRFGPYYDNQLLRQVVLRMKHFTGEGLAEAVGDLWGDHLAPRLWEMQADLIVPVPLHWRKRWQRGYNQSEVLAC